MDERARQASEKNNALMTEIKSRTRECYQEYRKNGYRRKFFETHREELTLHKAAKEAFDRLTDKKIPKIRDLSHEYEVVLTEKKKLYAEYRTQREVMKALLNAQKNVETILGREEKERDEAGRQDRKCP